MKNQTSTLIAAYAMARRTRNMLTTLLAGTFVTAQVIPSFATIDNTANAVGTYNGTTANYGSSSQSVPVAQPSLSVAKVAAAATSAAGLDGTITDAGDTITYTVTVTNNGATTMTNVLPIDQGVTFNGFAGTGTLSAFTPTSGSLPVTLAPAASQAFTAVYTLTQLDVDYGAQISNGIINKAGATGKAPNGTVFTVLPANYATATSDMPKNPKLKITKTFVIKDSTNTTTHLIAGVGDIVTYTYTVKNIGDVLMTGVTVNDQHGTPAVTVGTGAGGITNESLSSDGPMAPGSASTDLTANNGFWSNLQPGATVVFTWAHTVTQAEVDKG